MSDRMPQPSPTPDRRPAAPEAGAEPASNPAPFRDDALMLLDAEVPGRGPPLLRVDPREAWVESVTDWEHLATFREEWQALSDAAAEPNPFYEPWMLLPALHNFAGEGRVEVLLVFAPHPARPKHKVLLGLFPMQRRRGRLELWRHPYCYLSAPLLRRGAERVALARWLDALSARTGLVRIEDVPGDGPIRLYLLDELNARNWPAVVSAAYTRAVLKPAGSANEFLCRSLAAKRRRELRRQRVKLGELGPLVLEELDVRRDPTPWIDEFLALEAAGWKGREGVAAYRDRGFMQEMAAGAAQAGRLQMLALRVGGRPVALKLNLLCGEGAFAFKITFDEEFGRFSPGVQLELDNVERAHRLPRLRWMDSCAAPNRFMINHLWPDRREMQTLFFATGGFFGALTVAAVPLLNFLRARVRRP